MSTLDSGWNMQGDHLNLHVPFTKINKSKRLVKGIATSDKIDHSGEVIVASASVEAFSAFRGNIREMHETIAAGKMIKFDQTSVYDPKTSKFYNAISVDAYVSLGAEPTWQKVLDQTLMGFSIGGEILDDKVQYVPDLKKTVRFITKYQLTELSLVDVPCNPLANLISIEKSASGIYKVSGIAAEAQVKNIFWCESEQIAKTASEETIDCSSCETPMVNIGWVENNDDINKVVGETIQKHLGNNRESVTLSEDNLENNVVADNIVIKHTGGVNNMADEADETVNEVVEESTEEVVNSENDSDASEVVVEEVEATVDFETELKNLKIYIEAQRVSDKKEHLEGLKELSNVLEGIKVELSKGLETLKNENDALTKRFNEVSGSLESFAKRVETVEKGTAVRKSSDAVGDVKEPLKKSAPKSIWGGTFVPSESILEEDGGE